MKQRTYVLLTLFSAAFILAALTTQPAMASASNNANTLLKNSPPRMTANGSTRDHDDPLPLRTSHVARQAGGQTQNLVYGGGPVMAGTTHAYAIFWEPRGNVDAHYNSLIKRYFRDIGSSPLYRIARQYTQTNGTFPSNALLAASWVDQRAYPHIPILDNDIQNEVTHAQLVNGWHASMHNLFFVFTERDINVCIDSTLSQCTSNGYCAYHSAFGTDTLYAALPYVASFQCDPNPNPNHDDADKTITGISHEQIEAATDPLGNAWLDAQGNEVADKCAEFYGPTNAQGADVVWNNHPYMVQEEWDNRTSSCRLTPSDDFSHATTPAVRTK